MTNNIELLSNSEYFTIGTNSNLTEILANVVKIGTDTSNVTLSIPQDISSSYNLILPVRQGASGESLVYSADGQLKWHDPTVLKQIVTVYGSNLLSSLVSAGTHDNPTYLNNYIASIVPKSNNSKIFVQFKINYHAALSASNQISFYIKKTHDSNETIFSETLFGPYNAAGGFTGQYISNLIDQSSSTNTITYQLGYKVNGNVSIDDVVGILGYDSSYNNSILLQEFEGSGTTAISLWNKGSDNNGLYYNDGTVHIGSNKNAIDSINTPGVALELSGNLLGNNATFSGNINANNVIGDLTGNLTGDVTGNVDGNVQGINVTQLQATTIQTYSMALINQTNIGDKQNTITATTDLTMNDLTLNGYLRGPGNMYIDPSPNGVEGTIIINGSLIVKGNTTTIDAENLKISDNNITLNKEYTGGSPSENASIQIERGTLENSIIQWNENTDQWEFYKEGTGNLSTIKCSTIKVSEEATLGSVTASVNGTALEVTGNINTSYGVVSLSGTVSTINQFTNTNINNNSQILVYYTNSSGGDLTISSIINGCKTNISQDLTVIDGSSVLFCIVNINGVFILTISQLH